MDYFTFNRAKLRRRSKSLIKTYHSEFAAQERELQADILELQARTQRMEKLAMFRERHNIDA